MFTFSGDSFESEAQSIDSEKIIGSGNIRNDTFIRRTRMANFGTYNHWFRKSSDQYETATFLLPVGSVFVLTVVILLMVLFKRCPQLVAAIVAGILGTIIIFTILVTVNHPAVYE